MHVMKKRYKNGVVCICYAPSPALAPDFTTGPHQLHETGPGRHDFSILEIRNQEAEQCRLKLQSHKY